MGRSGNHVLKPRRKLSLGSVGGVCELRLGKRILGRCFIVICEEALCLGEYDLKREVIDGEEEQEDTQYFSLGNSSLDDFNVPIFANMSLYVSTMKRRGQSPDRKAPAGRMNSHYLS